MSKYKSFLYLSIGINTALFLLIANFKLHEKSFTISNELLGTTANEITESSKDKKSRIQSTLDKRPRLKQPINEGIDAIMEQVSRVDKAIDKIAAKAFKHSEQSEMNRAFRKNKGLETLHHTLHAAEVQLRLIYEQTILEVNRNTKENITDSLVLAVTQSIPKIDILGRLKQLNGCSQLTAQMIIKSLKLDFKNLEHIYVNEITKLVSKKDWKKYHRKVFVNTNKSVFKKGDTIEVDIHVGAFLRGIGKGSYFRVNGEKVYPDKNGMVDYKIIPNRKGKHDLRLNATIINPLNGMKSNTSSEFQYLAID